MIRGTFPVKEARYTLYLPSSRAPNSISREEGGAGEKDEMKREKRGGIRKVIAKKVISPAELENSTLKF